MITPELINDISEALKPLTKLTNSMDNISLGIINIAVATAIYIQPNYLPQMHEYAQKLFNINSSVHCKTHRCQETVITRFVGDFMQKYANESNQLIDILMYVRALNATQDLYRLQLLADCGLKIADELEKILIKAGIRD